VSNEHPDMHGNPADAPFYCEWCGRDFAEDKAYGVARNDELLFCSGECVADWEDNEADIEVEVRCMQLLPPAPEQPGSR